VFTLQGYFGRSDSLSSCPRIFCKFRQPSANFESRNSLVFTRQTLLKHKDTDNVTDSVFFILWNIPFLFGLSVGFEENNTYAKKSLRRHGMR